MIQRFWRWLGLHVHDWAKWQETGEIRRTADKGVIGMSQERVCTACGFKQYHKQYTI